MFSRLITSRGLPASLVLEKRFETSAEDEPARVAVVLDVTAKGGDGKKSVSRRGILGKWLVSGGSKHLELGR